MGEDGVSAAQQNAALGARSSFSVRGYHDHDTPNPHP